MSSSTLDLFKSLELDQVLPGVQGIAQQKNSSIQLQSFSPINNTLIGQVIVAQDSDYENLITAQQETFKSWRKVPAPQRGLIVKEMAEAIKAKQNLLGELITLEMGKLKSEGIGEVQEVIDIADYAIGLSRQLYGKIMQSERPAHRMYEQWHPLGIVGVITAFNYPMAVWGWNSMIAAVCGNCVIWKPSEHTPLSAIAINAICSKVAAKHGFPALFGLVIGDGPELGKRIAADVRIPLVSATGSCNMGRDVAQVVAKRLGRSLLELGGNNAVIVMDDADLNLAVRSTVFGAVGTSGQRCTTTRRAFIQKKIYNQFAERILSAYKQVKIGNPLINGIHMGPLINKNAVLAYQNALIAIKTQGGEIIYGGAHLGGLDSDLYIEPVLVKTNKVIPIMQEEVFAPILYLMPFDDLQQAIELQNSVAQGLSSSIFTKSLHNAELFLSAAGSDCGIANVNSGTSQAEVGGAFGGEKDTGGGREAGSDSWQQYMRRQTNTINFSDQLPLAQGLKFEIYT